jgi:hypothetical protein
MVVLCHGVSARTAALWPTYNPQDRKVGATCDSTPFFGKYDIAEWVGCTRTVIFLMSSPVGINGAPFGG